MASELAEWKANLEKEALYNVKNRLIEKVELMRTRWEEWKSSPFFLASDGFVNPTVPSDAPFVAPKMDLDTESGVTGPSPIERVDVHAETVPSHPLTALEVREFMMAQAIELESLASTIRLHLTFLAPPKRSADNLEASVQSEVSRRLDMVLSWCARFLSNMSSVATTRASIIGNTRKEMPSMDADQHVHEYDQIIMISFKGCFVELQFLSAFLLDTFEVRWIFAILFSLI